MRNLLIYSFGILFFLVSCEDRKKRTETGNGTVPKMEAIPEPEETGSQKIIEDKNNFDKITNENVVAFLTEYGKQNPETKVLISTSFGEIEIDLFEDTPLHRANMVYLIKQKYFDETFFHRTVSEFIIQAGNSDLRSTQVKRAELGKDYLLPAEIVPGRIHEYGTVSGAKEYRENPSHKSAPYEFYIFLGPKTSALHLNGKYTIFGKVTKGMDVVETISELNTDNSEWPLQNVYITAKVLE